MHLYKSVIHVLSLFVSGWLIDWLTDRPTDRPAPSWESSFASQEIPLILRSSSACHHVTKSSTLFSFLNQMNSVHVLLFYNFTIHFNVIFQPTAKSCIWSLSFTLPLKILAVLPHACHTFAHLILTPILFETGYKWWTSSLCSFLQYQITCCLSDQTISLSTLFSNTFWRILILPLKYSPFSVRKISTLVSCLKLFWTSLSSM